MAGGAMIPVGTDVAIRRGEVEIGGSSEGGNEGGETEAGRVEFPCDDAE